jgi:hypothetical protein
MGFTGFELTSDAVGTDIGSISTVKNDFAVV